MRDDSVQRITGDVYFDGKVDMRDLVYYIRYTIGAELGDFETECGDLTGDGNINKMCIRDRCTAPLCRASQSAIGMLAEDVFPYSAMLTKNFSSGTPNFSAANFMIL